MGKTTRVSNTKTPTQIFVVSDTDYEGLPYYLASTKPKAIKWIKKRQSDDIIRRRQQGWKESELEVSIEYWQDPEEFHPYTIDVMAVDEENCL